MNNPLLNPYITPFGTVPFDQIKNEHFQEAIYEAIKRGKAEIETIKNNSQPPTFENTIVALEYAGKDLSKATTVLFNLNSSETSDEIQKICRDVSPALTQYSNDIILDAALFDRVKTVYEQRAQYDLSIEAHTLLENCYKGFVRNGALLGDSEKEKLRAIDEEKSKIGLQYSENVLADTNAYELEVTEAEDVQDIPDSAVSQAKKLAEEKGKPESWIFTLDYPSFVPFLTYCNNRYLRQKMHKAYGARAFQDNENNNEAIVKRISELRQNRAELLGYASHAHFILEERMATSPETVIDFIEKLYNASFEAAQKEVAELNEYAKGLGAETPLQKWDFAYYSEKLKKEKYNIDAQMLKPYFSLEKVLQGAFEVANKLYGISFKKVDNISTYNEEVETYEVLDENGEHLSVFYADFHPRKGKRNGAWKTGFRSQEVVNGKDLRPHIIIVCNFPRGTEDAPALLTFGDVTTLFHEFGHALHGMLSKVTYSSLSGTSVFWDFVELPSQIMENWVYEKECLDLFAEHYETGEKIPQEYITRIQESAQYHQGTMTLRQLSLGLLDMAWHSGPIDLNLSVSDIEKKAMSKCDYLPSVEGSNTSCSFSHIFAGGYSAGYYSYKWAEVLDADAFSFFKEKGIFDKDTAARFRDHVLSKGGTEHPMELYKRFRGQEPDPKALLKRAGLSS